MCLTRKVNCVCTVLVQRRDRNAQMDLKTWKVVIGCFDEQLRLRHNTLKNDTGMILVWLLVLPLDMHLHSCDSRDSIGRIIPCELAINWQL